MYEAVKSIMAKQLRISPDKVTPEANIKTDLGADSIDILQLLMTVEEEFRVTVPDEKLRDFVTVNDVCTYLETLKKN